MNANELQRAITKAQDDSWESGYIAAQDGKPRTPPPGTSWPSQWIVGFDAATEDMAKRSSK